jgi:hypothetical protein
MARKLKIMEMRNTHCRTRNMANNSENLKNEKCKCRTWNKARNLKNVKNETQTLFDLEYREKH